MTLKDLNIVWLKRDLRLQDHEPLHRAEQAGVPYIIIYLFEPSIIEYPDTNLRHLQFVYHSLKSLNKQLKNYNRCVDIFMAKPIRPLVLFPRNIEYNNFLVIRKVEQKLLGNGIKKSNNFVKKTTFFGKKVNVMVL